MSNKQCKKRSSGFTLIEALVACIILAGALVALSGISNRSLMSIRLNRQYDQAWQLLDRQLAMIDYIGVDDFIEQGIDEGDIEEEGLTYHWAVETQTESIDQLYTVSITVSWNHLKRSHEISATTRMNGWSSATTIADARL